MLRGGLGRIACMALVFWSAPLAAEHTATSIGGVSTDEIEAALRFAGETLAFVERAAPRPVLAAELELLEKRFAETKQDGRDDLLL